MIYNAIVASIVAASKTFRERSLDENDRVLCPFVIRMLRWFAGWLNLLLVYRLALFDTFLFKSRWLFRWVPGVFQATGSLSAPWDGWGWIIKRMTSIQKYNWRNKTKTTFTSHRTNFWPAEQFHGHFVHTVPFNIFALFTRNFGLLSA